MLVRFQLGTQFWCGGEDITGTSGVSGAGSIPAEGIKSQQIVDN